MLETCHPSVVLVEKNVSRDMQESLLAKGMTLALDMKLSRLERIARCAGSEIISASDILAKPQLKHCDSFHTEKFVEEHSNPGGKKSCKTLMFLEGFPKPLGCTVSLMLPLLSLDCVNFFSRFFLCSFLCICWFFCIV